MGGRLRVDIAKWIAGLTGGYVSLTAAVPDAIERMAWVALTFILLDTLTGVWCAAQTGHVSSHRLGTRLIAKCLQYAILMVLAGAAALLVQTWSIVAAGIGAIVAIETLSLLENLTILERSGGVNLGPARPFIQRVSRYLLAGQDPQDPCKTCPLKEREEEERRP